VRAEAVGEGEGVEVRVCTRRAQAKVEGDAQAVCVGAEGDVGADQGAEGSAYASEGTELCVGAGGGARAGEDAEVCVWPWRAARVRVLAWRCLSGCGGRRGHGWRARVKARRCACGRGGRRGCGSRRGGGSGRRGERARE
jgi:hypothetical protein